ncbi:hypothetical protein KA005_62315, partial [bacterium]|nr:hypothetical protein [bacterium]
MKLIEFTKVCTKCGDRKNWLKFHKQKTGRFGRIAECIICINERNQEWKKENLEKAQKAVIKWQKENPEKKRKSNHEWYKKNFKKNKKRKRMWCKNNIDKMRKYRIKSQRKKCKNPMYKLNSAISVSINDSLHGNKNGRGWESIVGYTLKSLEKHLEKQFTDGMYWNNYGKGGWTLDHKIPLSVFNFKTTKHQDFKKA